MVHIYNFNTSPNRPNNPSKYPILKTNPWIPFSDLITWIINPTNTQIK